MAFGSYKHLTKTAIMHRGWTESLFEEYIGPPCKTGILNQHSGKYNVSVWHIDRILVLEKCPAVKERLKKKPRVPWK